MIKAEDLNITEQDYESYKGNPYGSFKMSDSQNWNFDVYKEDGTLNQANLDKLVESMNYIAFKQISRELDWLNTKGLLFNHLSDEDKEGLRKAVMAQVVHLFADGNIEIKTASAVSAGDVSVGRDITGVILTLDRIYQLTWDEINAYKLDEIEIEYDNNGNLIVANAAGYLKTIFKSGQDIRDISIEGNGEVILTKEEILKLTKGLAGIPYLHDAGYADYAEFANTAPDGEMVKYDSLPDGTPSKGIIYWKTPQGVLKINNSEDVNKAITEAMSISDVKLLALINDAF